MVPPTAALQAHWPSSWSHSPIMPMVPFLLHSHASQPSGVAARRFQNSGLQVSQMRPVTAALQVQSSPLGTSAQPPSRVKKVSVTPSGLQLHSSHSG